MNGQTFRRTAWTLALWALGLLAVPSAVAGDLGSAADRGTSGAQFLKIAPGARAAALGEACSILCEDAYAAYYNPASLGRLKRVEVAAAHNQHIQGVRHDFGAVVVPVLSWTESKRERNAFGVLAFSLTSLSVGGLERRGVVETDEPTGSFGASDLSYALSYGYAFDGPYSAGATLKKIEQRIDSARASAFALDAGGLYRRGDMAFSAGWRNFGSGIRFEGASDPLPFMLYAGAAWRPSARWLFALDLRQPRDHARGAALGVEYRRLFADGLSGSLRGGYNTSNTDADGLGGLSLGGGVSWRSMDFDVAWVPRGELGDTYRYSLRIRF